ncbi:TEPP [Branchiostoma lanceolatum]|uniref:TEPP protein n=1 Tax=Branchiostoma lanceolatum TaxID=7740 RepID=A0A8K0A725_BRALA|nr:TEPP [Branchiostoma lanceolatum]
MAAVADVRYRSAPPGPRAQPDMFYRYPSLQRVMLSSVKEGIYHPKLPSIRRMDMDTAGHRLPDEHCRTTTDIGPVDFSNATTTLQHPPNKTMSGLRITNTGKKTQRIKVDPSILDSEVKRDWATWLGRTTEIRGISHDPKDFHFTGYAVRHIRPSITSSWKYALRQEPTLDQYGQKPIPANIYSRYRDTYPQYSRDISRDAWR